MRFWRRDLSLPRGLRHPVAAATTTPARTRCRNPRDVRGIDDLRQRVHGAGSRNRPEQQTKTDEMENDGPGRLQQITLPGRIAYGKRSGEETSIWAGAREG